MPEPGTAARRAFALGHFRDAERLIGSGSGKSVAERTFAIQVAFYRGKPVCDAALDIVANADTSALDKSRCALIIASELRGKGQVSDSLEWYRRAVTFADESRDPAQRCSASQLLLARLADRAPFDGSLPLARQVRLLALRSGDPQVLAETHVTFAGLEGRVGHFAIAYRHLALARAHLEQSPSLLLSATVALDEAAIRGTEGDLAAGLSLSLEGKELAERSGWQRGILVGAVNCAHLSLALGAPEQSKKYVEEALAHQELGRNYRSALLNTRLEIAIGLGETDEISRCVAETR